MVYRKRLHIVDVEPGPGDLVVLQRVDQCGFVDDRPPRRIDQIGVRLHQADLMRANEADGAIALNHNDDDVVRTAKQIVLGDQLCTAFLGPITGHVLAPGNDFHAKGITDLGDLRANSPKTDDTQRLAPNLRADGGLPLALAHRPVVDRDVFGECQDQRPSQLKRR